VSAMHYQYRMTTNSEQGWSEWILCTKSKYEDCKIYPVHAGCTYEVRELYTESPDKAVAEFKEALHAHFDKFPIPTQLGIVTIMKHIEKVFKERQK
jgi:hypothetical protein